MLLNAADNQLNRFVQEVLAQLQDGEKWIFFIGIVVLIIAVIGISEWIKEHDNRQALSKTDEGRLLNAAREGDMATVKMFLDKGIDINVTPNENQPPLFKAIGKRRIEMVKFLLESGADCHGVYNEETALWLAVSIGESEIAQLLINKGVNVNDNRSRNKDTALEMAIRKEDDDMVALLRNAGASN